MLVNVGNGNYVDSDKILAVTRVDSNPVLKLVQAADSRNALIDVTWGRRRRSVVFLQGGTLVLSMLEPGTIMKRREGIK